LVLGLIVGEDVKNILLFERTVYILPLDRRFYRYCLLRQPGLIRFWFIRLAAAFLGFFGIYKKDGKKYNSLVWSYLNKVNGLDDKASSFWKHEDKKLYRLFHEDSNVWLTRYPEKLIRPLADRHEAELYSGDDYQLLYNTAAMHNKPLLVADAYPVKVKTEAETVLIYRGKVMKTAAHYRLSSALRGFYTFIMLLLSGIGLGLISMYFGAAQYLLDMFVSYFKNPWVPVLNIVPVLLLIFFLYFLFNRVWLSFLVSGILVLLASLINYYKLLLRNDPLLFSDIHYATEGGAMAFENYNLSINYKIILAVAILLICAAAAFFLVKGRMKSSRLRVLGMVCTAALFMLSYYRLYTNTTLYNSIENFGLVSRWSATGQYVSRGFVYPFLYSIKNAQEKPPEGYDEDEAAAVLNGYKYDYIPSDKKVNIVAVMLEAFNDFSKFGVLDFTEDVYAPLHELEAESLAGELITNIFAGNTVDTEWSFLTGYSDVESYRKNTNSYVRYLREQGYYAEGSHPCYNWFYNRLNVNKYLGFENYYFYEDKYNTGGNGIAGDDVLFPDIVKLLQDHVKSSDQPYFSFSVTYQNHGPYDGINAWYDKEYVKNKGYTDEEYHILNNYFSGIANTVKNVAETAEEFSKMEEPVVFIVFGDHNPWMGNSASVYKTLGINFDFNTEDGFYNYYDTPYVIYANNAAKEALGNDFVGKGESFSPCFLMNYFFKQAGLEGNEYMKLANDMYEVSPLVHMYGLFIQDGKLTYDLSEEGRETYNRFIRGQYYWEYNFKVRTAE
jgi:phosphoglycerol transferase MdoB-like AlkP superfamily enzyme